MLNADQYLHNYQLIGETAKLFQGGTLADEVRDVQFYLRISNLLPFGGCRMFGG